MTFDGLTFKNNTDVAIVCGNSEEVTFDGVAMTSVGSCIAIRGASDGCTVKNCDFGKFTGYCLNVSPSKHTTTLESNRIVIDNNYIHNYGDSTVFANQAIADNAIGTVISHNEFKDSPNGAVGLGTLSVIEYNVFDDMLNCSQDYGIIYTWNGITNRRNQIRYNLFMNMTANSRYGCYIDDFTQDQEIYGNVFYECGDCGVMLHNARNIFVHDNFFYYCNMSISGFGHYDPATGKANEGLLPDGTGWSEQYNRYYKQRINEGQEGYEIWKETFPSLYEFTPDTENAGDYNSFFSPWNSLHNNFILRADYGADGEIWPKIAHILDAYDNVIGDENENPYFVDPTHGDYTTKDGVTFMKIPFDLIGRY